MGILVLVIGIFGIISWFNVYAQASGMISTLSSVEQTAGGISEATGAFGWIPFIGGAAQGISGATGAVGQVAVTLRTTIQMFVFYNILLNVALTFIGIGLIDTGMGTSKITKAVRKTREYLRKERGEKN